MALLRALLLHCLAAAAAGASVKQTQTSGDLKLDRTSQAKHRLRVCNAYPSASAIDVYRGDKDERLFAKGSLTYKVCQDVQTVLRVGDILEFRDGTDGLGTFSVSSLPDSDAVMLLVVQRHDVANGAASFESHIFANVSSAQVAVIDAYRGSQQATASVTDAAGQSRAGRVETLRFNRVVAVNSGVYDVALVGQEGKRAARKTWVALPRENYVILRTGLDAKRGSSYDQELVVYPQSSEEALRAGRSRAARGAGSLLPAVLALVAGAALSLHT